MDTGIVIVVVGLYFLPWLAALGRGHRNATGIFVLDLLLGWTLLGWVVAMVWAVSGTDDKTADEPSSRTHVRCPDCRELVLKQARVCKHCGCRLVPQT